ncbi:hypothetical protein ACE6H2_018181 [Prunus campanulata]
MRIYGIMELKARWHHFMVDSTSRDFHYRVSIFREILTLPGKEQEKVSAGLGNHECLKGGSSFNSE